MDAKNEKRAPVPDTGATKQQSGKPNGDGMQGHKREGTANGGGDAVNERHVHRERDVGVGYGNSSGYGTEEHFTDGHADPIFKVG